MKKTYKKLIIGLICLVLVLAIGFTVYFVIANRKTTLYVRTYDRQYEFVFGEEQVQSFSIDVLSGNATVVMEGAEEFFAENIASGDYTVKSYTLSFNSFTYDCYILYDSGYYFLGYMDTSGKIVVENMASTVYDEINYTDYYFQFPACEVSNYIYDTASGFIEWENLVGYNSFDELVSFYGNIAEGYCVIDEENKIIKLNGCDSMNMHEMTEGYPITLICTDDGVEIQSNFSES